VVPELRPFGPDHLAACHFPLQTPTNGDGAGQQAQATPVAAVDPVADSPPESKSDNGR
jgi:hypothetical protein